MLGTAKTDTLQRRVQLLCLASCGSIRVGSYAESSYTCQPSSIILPKYPLLGSAGTVGIAHVVDVTGGTVERDRVAFVEGLACKCEATCSSSSILMSPQPETQQVPIPRATTAACEVMSAANGQDTLSSTSYPRYPREKFQVLQEQPFRLFLPWLTASSAVNTIVPAGSTGRSSDTLADRCLRLLKSRCVERAGAEAYQGS